MHTHHFVVLAGLWVVLLPLTLLGQELPTLEVPVWVEGRQLAWPLAGGLNAPQFSAADANGDGLPDIHVFDRLDNRQLVFVQEQTAEGARYLYAPAWAQHFPDAEHWVLLRDFDGDGAADVFSSSQHPDEDISGVRMHRGYYDHDTLRFEPPAWGRDVLNYTDATGQTAPIFVDANAYPAIADMDCDGDLDVLAFGLGGGHLNLYCNQSVERGFGTDSLLFVLCHPCWGGFFEDGISLEVHLSESAEGCASSGGFWAPAVHGGVSLLDMDADGDGDVDLWLGDSVHDALNLLTNGGNCPAPWANAQNPAALAAPGALPTYPTAYHLDVDGDGRRDLLVSPSFRLVADDRRAVVWRYQNVGTDLMPVFVFQEDDFLVSDMIDLGTGANPTFADVNADGLLDMVVGNTSLGSDYAQHSPRLFLFLNVGTAAAPAFALADADFGGMGQFAAATHSFAPTFGDLDGDGDSDLLVGEALGRLFYAENTAGAGQPMQLGAPVYDYQSIDVGQYSTPQLIDLTGDGLLDLLVGERNGNVNFFPNIGSPTQAAFVGNPAEAHNIAQFGGVDTRVPGMSSGYSAPFAVRLASGDYWLLAGTEHGQVEVYTFGPEGLNGAFAQLHTHYGGARPGIRTRPALADLDADGLLDYWVGNQSGGLLAWRTPLVPYAPPNRVHQSGEQSLAVAVYPNPAAGGHVSVALLGAGGGQARWWLHHITGQGVGHGQWMGTLGSIDVSGLPAGVYLLEVESGGARATVRIVRR